MNIKEISMNFFKSGRMKIFFYFCISLFLFFLAFLAVWGGLSVGDVEFEKIYFHMFMPLNAAHTSWIKGIWVVFLGPVVVNFVVFYIFKKFGLLADYFILILFLLAFNCWYIEKHFSVYNFLKAQWNSSDFIEKHYVAPKMADIVFPEKKKNLVVIMVESLESSYQDKKNGGLFSENYIPELTALAKQHISFAGSDKFDGAFVPPESGWTIAATVAQTAGVPLKLYGTPKGKNKEREIDNRMGEYKYFLPGVVALGDILEHNGYRNYFILGTDAEFAGKAAYMQQHGHYAVYDRTRAKGFYTDTELFEEAKKKMNFISKRPPFSVMIQTIDSHFIRKNSFRKVSFLVSSFVQWLKQQPYFKDTVVVVVGDHCNMLQLDFNNLESDEFRYMGNMQRKVYNVFINSVNRPVAEKNRTFSIMDFFPTMLSAVGAEIKGDRLGLGTNLFSDQKTLFEIYNPDYVFQELRKKSHWYDTKLLKKNESKN